VVCHVGRGMQLGNFEYTATPLALGASGGNQFELTLRALSGASTDQASSALGSPPAEAPSVCSAAQNGRWPQNGRPTRI